MIKTRFFIILIFLLILTSLHGQELITGGEGASALTAAEEFRIGTHAFNRFEYNEAIRAFEQALTFRPGQPLILEWLGKAYYRSGFEETAIRQWRAAMDAYGRSSGQGLLLGTKIETVSNRRFLLPIANDGIRYVESGRYPGRIEQITLYRQPTSVLANNDGTAWVVAYGSNEIVKIDVNGIIRDRKRGPLNGFDRPYDIVRGLDGRLYISEFRGGRVSILDSNGNWQGYIGERGIRDGQLVGPQNLTIDEEGYLFVVDYGNRRISKFDPDGQFIISFGLRSAAFPGMLSPTGIAAGKGRIFVADSVAKVIYMFDPNGYYLGILESDGFIGPESLRFISDGTLLVADTSRVLQINVDSAIARELGSIGGNRTRITGADMDSNGNILAANFNAGEVSVMTRFDDLASGFFVQVRNINADRFPQVTVHLTVEDRLRRPIVGLDSNNFLLTENGFPVNQQVLLTPGYRYNGADISLLVERSPATAALRDDLNAAARDINRAINEMNQANMTARITSVIGAGTQPRRERHDLSLETAVRGTQDSYHAAWRFDMALRVAATDLLPVSPKRSVVYIGSGDLGELAFEQYSLSEMAAYLANNGIVFNAIIVGGYSVSESLEYLCFETGGRAMHLYRPRGIGELIKSVAETPTGLYSFTYTSRMRTDFGRAWLPLEAEVYLIERSGRDTTGYFPPME